MRHYTERRLMDLADRIQNDPPHSRQEEKYRKLLGVYLKLIRRCL